MKQFASKVAAIALAATIPMAAMAESSTASSGTVSAAVNFSITIPKFVYLQVGPAAAGTQSTITFSPAVGVLPGTVVAGTGGDLTGGAVTAKVLGNAGALSLAAAATGFTTVPASEISVATATVTSSTALPHPAIGGSTALTATNSVVNQDAKWTYSYLNTVAYAPGTYTGGKVTYSILVP